jgi:hypothetical protein
MNIVKLINQWRELDLVTGIGLLLLLLLGLIYAYNRFGFYTWYIIIFMGGIIPAYLEGSQAYLYAFIIGVVVAFSEIIGKFNDEPIKSLITPHAVIYHLVNGLMAVFALKLMVLNNEGHMPTLEMDKVKYVLGAGIGSMAFFRSKIFTMKIAEQDVSFGPEQLINVYFRFMEKEIDRTRGAMRIDFIVKNLANIKFELFYKAVKIMLYASQVITKDKKEDILRHAKTLNDDSDLDSQSKSYELGFELLNEMGEHFISKLLEKCITDEWYINKELKPNTPPQSETIIEQCKKGLSKLASGIRPSTDKSKTELSDGVEDKSKTELADGVEDKSKTELADNVKENSNL